MGIAGFYLWLQRWYAEAVQILGDAPEDGEGPTEPRVDKPFDNLYLDMNGLIHPCCHDTAPLPEPQTEEEMFVRVFRTVEELVRVARPRRCLVLAVDGVAPRSKMNQQRSRRFRSANEHIETAEIATTQADFIVAQYNLPRPAVKPRWDHNVITPSTAFMERMGQALEWFVLQKLNTDPQWKELCVVFSDADVPGEGEHKIMHYVRGLRSRPGYNPNTSHCIFGMDADLIVLGLATHEAHFGILRNQLDPTTFGPVAGTYCSFGVDKFRQLLKRDFSLLGEDVDFERVIDDFVFLCFFVGNDFLPHVPLVSIKTRGIEMLLDHYVHSFPNHGFLTKGGEIRFRRVAIYLRSFVTERFEELVQFKKGDAIAAHHATTRHAAALQEIDNEVENVLAARAPDGSIDQQISDQLLGLLVSKEKKRRTFVSGRHPLPFEYGAPNYRAAYYFSKFGLGDDPSFAVLCNDDVGQPNAATADTSILAPEVEAEIQRIAHEYLRGMQWVLRYYTHGCPSWEWFYPYHYAPLLEDLSKCAVVDTAMIIGKPLHPVMQLLAVLPRESVSALPDELKGAVEDRTSVLAQFYPAHLTVDYSECMYAHQGTARLPFIDCRTLLTACRDVVNLEPTHSTSLVFAHSSSRACRELEKLLTDAQTEDGAQFAVPLVNSSIRTPIAGRIGYYDEEVPLNATVLCPDTGLALFTQEYAASIKCNRVRCFAYEFNVFAEYQQRILPGTRERFAAKVVTADGGAQPQEEPRGRKRARDRDKSPQSPPHRKLSPKPSARTRTLSPARGSGKGQKKQKHTAARSASAKEYRGRGFSPASRRAKEEKAAPE